MGIAYEHRDRPHSSQYLRIHVLLSGISFGSCVNADAVLKWAKQLFINWAFHRAKTTDVYINVYLYVRGGNASMFPDFAYYNAFNRNNEHAMALIHFAQ